MASDWPDRYVILGTGLALPIAPVLFLLDLEARDCRVWRDGDILRVSPAAALSAEDKALLRRWKWHLLMLVDRCAVTEAH